MVSTVKNPLGDGSHVDVWLTRVQLELNRLSIGTAAISKELLDESKQRLAPPESCHMSRLRVAGFSER